MSSPSNGFVSVTSKRQQNHSGYSRPPYNGNKVPSSLDSPKSSMYGLASSVESEGAAENERPLKPFYQQHHQSHDGSPLRRDGQQNANSPSNYRNYRNRGVEGQESRNDDSSYRNYQRQPTEEGGWIPAPSHHHNTNRYNSNNHYHQSGGYDNRDRQFRRPNNQQDNYNGQYTSVGKNRKSSFSSSQNASNVNSSAGVESSAFSNPFAYLQEMGSNDASEAEGSHGTSSNVSSVLNSPSGSDDEDCNDLNIESCNEEILREKEALRKEEIIGELGPGPHLLAHEWSFWFLQPPIGSKSNQTNYESLLKQVGSFKTVDEFWSIYLRLKRSYHFTKGTTDYSLFHSDIRPVWEDQSNSNGGKLMIRLKKEGVVSSRLWEAMVLALVGGEFEAFDNDICGLVFSIRPYEDILSIWTRHSQDMSAIQQLRESMREVLKLSAGTVIEYKAHHFTKEAPKSKETESVVLPVVSEVNSSS